MPLSWRCHPCSTLSRAATPWSALPQPVYHRLAYPRCALYVRVFVSVFVCVCARVYLS